MAKQKKILIVEDEDDLLEALTEGLDGHGFAVVTAKDGEDGLQKAEAERPDLILLDILMPNMDGMAMLRRLRAQEWGKDIPVTILTNVQDTAKVAEAMEHGTYDYLEKTEHTIGEIVENLRKKLEE